MSRLSAGERLRRLLSIVPWVAAHDGPTLDEVAARFDYPRDRLVEDLTEVVFMVGIYPFTPDQLIEVVVEDERVWINYAEYFARPLRLTPEQALGLVAAGKSLLAAPGAEADGPLARGLAKLADVLKVDPDQALDIELGEGAAEILEALRDAEADHRAVEIDYYGYGRDERSVRAIEPHRVFADQGQWYVAAHCRAAGGERVFRLDRIHEIRPLDEHFEPPDVLPAAAIFRPRPEDPRVTVELDAEAAWVVDHFPSEHVAKAKDGRVTATLAVTAIPWLERLLVRLGPHARLIDATHGVPDDVGSVAAHRILARYQAQ